nr:MAG: deoxyuridine 5'-triphosphate nucleotidohydrolase [Sphaerobacter thermophilus]
MPMPHNLSAGVLSREQLLELLDGEPPLVTGLRDREAQVQPNGIDLTLDSVANFTGPGTLTVDNAGRRLADSTDLTFGPDGQLYLSPGAYLVRFTETVNLPADLMAYLRPRSTLLRSGVALHTAVWDAGYAGRGQSLLVVYNPHGFRVQHGARIGQLVFHRLAAATAEGYDGIYQGEATDRR